MTVEREVRASSSARAPDLVAKFGEVDRLREELQETMADNEQFSYNMSETVPGGFRCRKARTHLFEETTLPSDPDELFDTSQRQRSQ